MSKIFYIIVANAMLNYRVLLPLMGLCTIMSCTKNIDAAAENKLGIGLYRTITLKSLPNPAPNNNRTNNTEQFPTIAASDFNNTYFKSQTDQNNNISEAFVTPIYRENDYFAAIVGFKAPNNRLLNVVYVCNQIDNFLFKYDLYYIDGTPIGTYSVLNNQVVDVQTIGNPDNNTASGQARTWWGCTRECISDAHIACYSDQQCMTLLTITNVAGTGTSMSGQGSLSISVACGIACVKNKNLDLLPQH